ncbi:MAG: right-handed parallel beta-helix repeat-containing protein, partial [Gemmatimonadetes bacterium]|nr:right-handed parallel beta-helix repeat-containing protein [Gemmatimonadota bacterium]
AGAAGDLIRVEPGEYLESLDYLGKDLTVQSTGGPPATGIRPPASGGSCAVFRNGETRDAVLEGFTLHDGTGTDDGGTLRGGGAFCHGASPTIRDCVLRDHHTGYAAAIYIRAGASPRIEDCEFLDNVSDSWGGAIGGGDGEVVIERCLFEGNSAVRNGTIYLVNTLPDPMLVTVRDCVFRMNTAAEGAGIEVPNAGAYHLVERCRFENNFSFLYHGAGVRVHEADVEIRDCVFVGNQATEDGGAVLALDGGVTHVAGCTFYGNSSLRNGGAVAAWYGSTIALDHCILAETTGQPATFCGLSGTLTFTCCDFWGNDLGNFSGSCGDVLGVNGNFDANPVFCDAAGGDFTLRADSPCAPTGGLCGLVGALGVGCGTVSIEATGWGELKARFR